MKLKGYRHVVKKVSHNDYYTTVRGLKRRAKRLCFDTLGQEITK